jgi:hypothetical protein
METKERRNVKANDRWEHFFMKNLNLRHGSSPRLSAAGCTHLQKVQQMEPIADLVAASIDDLLIDHVIYVRGRPGRIVSLDFPLVFWQFDGEEVVKHRSFNASRALFQVSAADAAANASAAAAKSKRSASLDSSSDSSDDHDDWASFENAPPLPDNSPPNSTESSSVAASTASAASFDDGFDDSELDFAAVGVDKVEAVEPAPAAEPVSSPSDLASKYAFSRFVPLTRCMLIFDIRL